MKLNISNIAKLKCPTDKAEVAYPDHEVRGLVLRVYEGGKKTWNFRFRDANGRSRRLIIGDGSTIDPVQARALARKAAVEVAGGSNPVERRKAARRAKTCLSLFEGFLTHAEREYRPQSYDHAKRHLLKYAARLHTQPIEAVKRADIAALRDDLAKTSGVVTANRCISTIATAWGWTIRNAFIDSETNPANYVSKLKELPRDRVLTMAELAAIWDATSGDHVHDRLVRFLMLTGVRREEGAGMRWSELHGSLWTIPAARMKEGAPHEVTLPKEALAVIGKRTNHECVFGGETPFSNWSKRKYMLDAACGVKDWGLHDFRRSLSTALNADGRVPPHVIEATLSHTGVKAGVAGIYNQASYRRQKAEALEQWVNLLREGGVFR